MASKRVSQLDTITSLNVDDVFVVNQLGSTKKVPYNTITSSISSTVSQNLTGDFIKRPPSATAQQVLTYDGSTSTWVASGLTKELPSTATAQQILTYDGTTWVASAAPTGGSSGVIIDSTSIATGDTSYLLKLADANKVMLCNNTNPLTASLPANIFTVGTEIIMIQRGGVVTLSAGAGVTFESNGNKFKTNGTSAGVCLINIANNTWFLGGNTAT
jgi:hypothetical protein